MFKKLLLTLALLCSSALFAQTTYFTPVLTTYPDGGDEMITDGGSYYNASYDETCYISPMPPILTIWSTTTGTVNGYVGTAEQLSSVMQSSVVYNGSSSAKFHYFGPIGCTSKYVQFNENDIEVELAVSFGLNAGGVQYDYKASPSCSNLSPVLWASIDYFPWNGVYDTYSSAWKFGSVCERRYQQTRHWSCIPGIAIKATGSGGPCTYNP